MEKNLEAELSSSKSNVQLKSFSVKKENPGYKTDKDNVAVYENKAFQNTETLQKVSDNDEMSKSKGTKFPEDNRFICPSLDN